MAMASIRPAGYPLIAALAMEIVQTALFVLLICRVTRGNGAGNLAPVAIGLTLALMHIMSIPVANTSLNPARSIASAVIEGGWAWQQLWLFILAPLAGRSYRRLRLISISVKFSNLPSVTNSKGGP